MPLIVGGCLSLAAALLHIAIIFGGADWYRFFGAGEEMAQMAASGDHFPTVITGGIALVLGIWAAYAFAGAGIIRSLPLTQTALVIITLAYLVRGVAPFVLTIVTSEPMTSFMIWSSLICTLYGLAYLVGTKRAWASLS